MTVGAAGAHFRSVRGQPADFQSFAHAHLGEQLAEHKHALSAEARDLEGEGLEVVSVLRAARAGGFALD